MTSNNLKPLLLHAHATGPNPYKVAILLEHLRIPYDVKLWTFAADSHGVKGPDFLAINPNGRVPALQDPNTNVTSWESLACLNYLLRNYDHDNKFGPRPEAGERGRVEVEQWVSFLVSTVGPMIGQCNWFRNYNAVENEDAYKRYEAQACRCFGVLEGQLGTHDGRWVIEGETPGVVDFHFEPWLRQHGYAGLALDDYPKVRAWLERVQALPELQRAYGKVKSGQEA
ncbi:Glutathione S-transferase-like protein tpcF [Colletotrichum sidae]|uniref:Glutathione S-transferase-like protein tpcF n=1 Tax=Colletotrichum sidae TaxID=1347389 RepID=A0A4R8T281_9PEZI|nr:Glutathione S-transferase-like protein tpcF [Colletotrichum sidae]